jgi:hypothetical protein
MRKSKGAEDEAEKPTGTVPVTVHRFSKASQVADGEHEQDADRNGDIPFANRGGVNAIDVLSKLCEELIEAYMDKLEERARAAEDAATRREQKTMYRALEAFQEELRTRLLEHVSCAVRFLLHKVADGGSRRSPWTRYMRSARGCGRRKRRS